MDLADILGREQIVPELRATNRWEAIDELIGNLVATGKIQPGDRDAVTAAVKKRETSMSTGIGFGIGIPHASTDLIYEVVGALGRSAKGVNFDALDNQPVKLVMLFLVPQGQFQKHLHTLANIAKLLHKADFREALEKSTDADAMLGVIREHGKKVTVQLQAADRWQAIEELIQHLLDRGQIQPQHHQEILAAVKKREQAMSTGIGLGIAIPHATTEYVPDLISVIGRSEKGIDFGAPDGQPVRKIALFLVPAGQFQKHLHALADFAKMLHREDI